MKNFGKSFSILAGSLVSENYFSIPIENKKSCLSQHNQAHASFDRV